MSKSCDVEFAICPEHGPKMNGVVLSREQGRYFRDFFVLKRVRVSNPLREPYTQTWVKCPSPLRERIKRFFPSDQVSVIERHHRYATLEFWVSDANAAILDFKSRGRLWRVREYDLTFFFSFLAFFGLQI